MTQRRTAIVRCQQHSPDFFWRGLLIVLPVVVLTAFGILSLRQDRKLVESEVRERAREFAVEAAERCWKWLTSLAAADWVHPPSARDAGTQSSGSVFRVSTAGSLVIPAAYSTVPAPSPVDPTRLDPEQASLWQHIEIAAATNAPAASQIADLRTFLGTNPHTEFAALAHYRLAMLLHKKDPQQASAELQVLLDQFPQSLGETGLPLSALAMTQLAEMSLPAGAGKQSEVRTTLEQLSSNAVARPSVLTPWILNQVADREQRYLGSTDLAEHWRSVWNLDEESRRAFRAALRSLFKTAAPEWTGVTQGTSTPVRTAGPVSAWPELFWFSQAEPLPTATNSAYLSEQNTTWLAAQSQRFDDGSALFIYRDLDQVVSLLKELGEAERTLPGYLGVHYQIAGRPFGGVKWRQSVRTQASNPSAAGLPAETEMPRDLLASASHRVNDRAGLVTVAVSLLDPAALYARQRQRVFWFGALIVVSSVVALLGLISTWSAFQQQQRLYQMQTNFVSSVTHELRAPIGAVRLMAENFKLGKVQEPAEQQQFFQYIVQECCRLSSLIENVLNLARIEQGRKEYDFEPTDVVRLVTDTVKLMEANAAECQIALQLELDRSEFSSMKEEAILDGRAIQQALINLIDNAVKHSPANSAVTIGMALVNDCGSSSPSRGSSPPPTPAPWLRFWVADQGPGIPAEEHQKIFDRFYRRGSELRRETPGVGIGLSIVKHILAAHRGKVWVESEVGKGSRFILELPLTQSGDAGPKPGR
jgi:signal transduction histidine kinase